MAAFYFGYDWVMIFKLNKRMAPWKRYGLFLYLQVWRWRTHFSLVTVRHEMNMTVKILLEVDSLPCILLFSLTLTIWPCQGLKMPTCKIVTWAGKCLLNYLADKWEMWVSPWFFLSFSSKHCGYPEPILTQICLFCWSENVPRAMMKERVLFCHFSK